jgi:hypothetical protein
LHTILLTSSGEPNYVHSFFKFHIEIKYIYIERKGARLELIDQNEKFGSSIT